MPKVFFVEFIQPKLLGVCFSDQPNLLLFTSYDLSDREAIKRLLEDVHFKEYEAVGEYFSKH
ncbi:hypothetical protein [Crocosphaera sp.]|uniref:hypothetical protein n=1 Tax=Crocosphaera sp. TaxID=2729996 RepID=UPI00260D8398|nr:hypothetical protein [Crocosphaera sp.]MDJ0579660.1 hypothetical protein [Crocosphaera sp.]